MAISLRGLAMLGLLLPLAAGGCKAGKPGAFDQRVAQFVKHEVTIGGGEDRNPLSATLANVRDGERHFGHHCAVCHGLDGQATGVPFADNMSPPIPPLASHGVQEYRDGQLRWIIRNGISPSGMPAWDDVLSDDEIWKIVLYIRHLPPEGSLGVPPIYKEADEDHRTIVVHAASASGASGVSR
jgi:mono/diheme cytochrome c family protein